MMEMQDEGAVVSPVLKALVIGMGILIVLGTAGLVGVIIHRMSHPSTTGLSVVSAAVPGAPLLLSEPEGTRILSMTRMNDHLLAVQLTGGGADRVVLWDVTRNGVAGRLALSR